MNPERFLGVHFSNPAPFIPGVELIPHEGTDAKAIELVEEIVAATGKETVVFSCFNQDQPLDQVDWPILNERLRQNAVQEKLTRAWIDRCLKRLELRPGG